ncbi:helix-turn-helix transcriptional regulator [Mucilaginibacter corticis]|uniref:Helix-turn-helix transcriptional regulator n=1 Tax=Mucilaginibacter corticis TaxID=2597670 RepID=A0A556M8U3_9SPHI|nr:helix-turn-helix transcriptional regulator [Mucilaginibacter corticis]
MPLNIKKTLLNIRQRRENLQYSQEYVASKLKLTQHAYSKIECGVTEITLRRLGEISDILLTRPSALIES